MVFAVHVGDSTDHSLVQSSAAPPALIPLIACEGRWRRLWELTSLTDLDPLADVPAARRQIQAVRVRHVCAWVCVCVPVLENTQRFCSVSADLIDIQDMIGYWESFHLLHLVSWSPGHHVTGLLVTWSPSLLGPLLCG